VYHSNGLLISNWQCVNEKGHIRLWFNAPNGNGFDITNELRGRYSVDKNFNCPDE
jgi:hypothetical protein